ncbi:transcription termination factor 2 [Asbolus verrucosus]|uniref:Transcription termination factor 2 n=1 Tax=Asbolus verrucosus TaxID=1661398 RepID=A0A482VZZ1_ASBVE|nr:transcription termination factor 2 [Asbolus verrucosus]
MAVETLNELHKSLANCPTENDLMEDPKGLKVPLMTHQKRALTWLLWREQQKPSGGILADDMGLGKTLTMISLVIKTLQLEQSDDVDKENYRDKYPGGTLVICPASLINQWSSEVERRTKRGLLSVEVYHGSKRETKSKRLAKHDMVITTYAIILNEVNKNSTVFGVRWRRIILDEAHQIRNHKARTSDAVYSLSGKSRWALTGTPVHNRELDMYSLLKFLRCSPFDDLQVWKHWVSDKSTGGQMRLHAVISSLMLRRTKSELMDKGVLQNLPERKWQLVSVKLEKEEMDIYQKVLIFSRTLFAQFLHQKAAKNQDEINFRFTGAPPDPNGEYFKMRNRLLKLNRVKEVSQHHILVLLLRLRQICCHPSLITKMLQGDEDLGNAEDEESEEINLLEQLNRLDINDDEDHMAESNEQAVGLKEASKAGGVGLNLIGANHLFLLDLHWNPQLENQAQDRIYRMGQTKNIFVYKFMALDTIEQRIKFLQETKLEMADSMLTGSKKVISSKLTLQDLKMLFEFK